jgi:hypothetical protein
MVLWGRCILSGLFFDKNFALSIGPQRAGARWIDRYLRGRGDVCLPTHVKEIFYFDRHFERGPEFYFGHFRYLPQHKIGVEVTTTAFDHPEAPARVHQMFREGVKLICPLRHPVERSYSLYQHLLRYGIVQGNLSEAVEQAPQILQGSRYAQHLERWTRFFPLSGLHLMFQEALEADPAAYVTRLCAVLGLPYKPHKQDSEGFNALGVSRFPGLAHRMERVSGFMTRNGLDRSLGLARSLGLWRLVFGPEPFDVRRLSIPREDHEWLSSRLIPEVEKLEALVGGPIMPWRSA